MSILVYEPLNTLKQIGKNIWVADGDIIGMDVLMFKVPFSTRMAIVKLKDGSLWCHSPIKPTASLLSEINQLEAVKYLISPNKIHYAYIPEWKKYYPNAIGWAIPGVEKRTASQNISMKFDQALEETATLEWANEISQLIFKGSRVIEEVAFYHHSSRTLILTDLIENFEPKRTKNPFWRSIYKIAGISDPNGQTPVDMRLTFLEQKELARHSFNQMLEWQPERILIFHGRWYEKDGVVELKQAFNWLNKK